MDELEAAIIKRNATGALRRMVGTPLALKGYPELAPEATNIVEAIQAVKRIIAFCDESGPVAELSSELGEVAR